MGLKLLWSNFSLKLSASDLEFFNLLSRRLNHFDRNNLSSVGTLSTSNTLNGRKHKF